MAIVGLIPCAGRSSRFSYVTPKEMMPYRIDKKTGGPVPVSRHVFDMMLKAGAKKIYFVASPNRTPLFSYYGDGSEYGVAIGYIIQREPKGLADAMNKVLPFLSDDDYILFGMPDTYVLPEESFSLLYKKLKQSDADVVLGLYKVNNVKELCAVSVKDDSTYLFEDKSANPKSDWAWGIMAFRKRYLEISSTMNYKPKGLSEFTVADVLNSGKLKIEVNKFQNGRFLDFKNFEVLYRFMIGK